MTHAVEANTDAGASDDSGGSSPKSQQLAIAPPPIDYRRLLTLFFQKYDKKRANEVDALLKKHAGKESKLMLLLARKYDGSNALNAVFSKAVTDAHFEDHLALTQLYLSVFYPQDIAQAEALCAKYKGKEDTLFTKLSSNFCALNPLKKKDDAKEPALTPQPVDYKGLLTAFFQEHDEAKVEEAEAMLAKCPRGKEEVLFSVLASQYSTTNALVSVFEERLKGAECKDHAGLLHLYFSVFHPSKASDAKAMLAQYRGKEAKLFALLAAKFRACNALEACDKLGKPMLGSIGEEGEEKDAVPAVTEDGKGGCASPKRAVRRVAVPASPAVTP
ncbi:hypothetical protein ACHAXT_012014 [Thalassiosira profunda]